MSEVETAHDRTMFVMDTVGEWANEHNAAFLAKENEVVWWYSITGEDEDYEWHKCSPVELARLIKVTRLSHDYMAAISSDVIIAAFQEHGRAFMAGVRSPKKVLPEYFNYLEHEVVLTSEYNITLKVVHWFQQARINPEWMMVKELIKELILDAGHDPAGDIAVNKWMKQACAECKLTAYHGNTRYRQGDRRYPCIYNKMLRPRRPITTEISEEMIESIKESLNQ